MENEEKAKTFTEYSYDRDTNTHTESIWYLRKCPKCGFEDYLYINCFKCPYCGADLEE